MFEAEANKLTYRMHNLKPKKYLGQHFLTDQGAAQRIVDLLAADGSDPVVEIGPGQGVLTFRLMERFSQLTLVEVDPEAIAWLHANLPEPQPRLLHRDVLKWQPSETLEGPAAFVGNLPYNISSPFFFLLLGQLDYVAEGVFMIQKEVADRICAGPGSKTYGILSVLLGAYFHCVYAFSVPPEAFRPPPKVMSGVIRLQPRETRPEVSFPALKRVVKTAFQQRRKTLRNALKSLPLDLPESLGSQRAEQLEIEVFVDLARQLGGGE